MLQTLPRPRAEKMSLSVAFAPMASPLAYSPKTAAAAAGVPIGTIWQWIKSGRLDARFSGRRRVIEAGALRAAIASLPRKRAV